MYVSVNKITAHMYWFLLRSMYINSEFVLMALGTMIFLLDCELAYKINDFLYNLRKYQHK